ncbi:MAG: NAD-dependent epimerase/dehydratase family protein [Candidatus Margulisiibacteriota bacterium]
MKNISETILVTGSAGFIGFHVSKALLEKGCKVIGVDNLNTYYDIKLKKDRLKILKAYPEFTFIKLDLCNRTKLKKIFEKYSFSKICHLAAQAGVRYSLKNPFEYQRSNLEGFLSVIDLAKEFKVKKFVYASSSSVYGGNTKIPFSIKDDVSHPVSFYGATKRANELIAYTYHHLYNLPVVGLRFFTVYGPWGRPDMAYYGFTKAILEGRSIDIYNFGKMKRDFTYIDDIVDGVLNSLEKPFECELFNLGNSNTVDLLYFIECIEKGLSKKADKKMMPIQPGDVPETYADIDYSREKLGFEPKIKIEEGINRFLKWYKEYYGVKS